MVFRPLVATVVLALALAACGGRGDVGELAGAPLPVDGEVLSSEELCAMTMADFDNVGPAPMSPDIAAIACDGYRMQSSEFVTQANALCADANALSAALVAADPGVQLERRAEIGELQLKNFEALRALAPLPDVEVTLDAVVDVLGRAVQLRHESVAAASASDGRALQELEARLADVEREFVALANGAGLRDCA
ncbi:MAG: hypothetical protein ACR2OD_08365 [Gaiellaceae bacterium]